jgi:hypothetical protein
MPARNVVAVTLKHYRRCIIPGVQILSVCLRKGAAEVLTLENDANPTCALLRNGIGCQRENIYLMLTECVRACHEAYFEIDSIESGYG